MLSDEWLQRYRLLENFTAKWNGNGNGNRNGNGNAYDRGDYNSSFALRAVELKSSGATPLLSADGSTLLTDKDAILKRWAEHFNSVLNRPSSVNDNAINSLPQIECNVLLDEFPTVTETR